VTDRRRIYLDDEGSERVNTETEQPNLKPKYVEELEARTLVAEKQVREAVLQELRLHFKPEFLNRIDDIVVFHQLSRDQIGKIIDVQLERLIAMLNERNVKLVLEPSAKELLMREGYDPTYGARPLKRAIQSLIQNPLAVKLLQGEIQPGQTVHVMANGDAMEFKTGAAFATA
jgi:ATP-dependent Clp protease ATP-binding subunit ClpB